MTKNAVKLPKIEIKYFSGDYTCWRSFKETFEVTVHWRRDLTKIEKFTQLRSLLDKTASQAIEGLPLTAENYTAARTLENYTIMLKVMCGRLKILGSAMNSLVHY